MSVATPDVVEDLSTDTMPSPTTAWLVILWNDDVNTFPYVIRTLQMVLEEPEEQCEEYAWKAHREGRTPIYRGDKQKALNIAAQLGSAMLQVTLERE